MEAEGEAFKGVTGDDRSKSRTTASAMPLLRPGCLDQCSGPVCTMPHSASTPTWGFIPKDQSLPFVVDDISGSRALSLFLVEDGASMIVASTIVPERSEMPLSARCAFTSAKSASVSPCRSSRWRKLRIVVSSGMRSSPNSMPAKRRIASLSYSVSSAIGSLRAYQFCRKYTRSIVSSSIGGRPPFGLALG